MIIGKRNVNCLSCAKEPNRHHGSGNDGRIYRGLNKKDGSPKKVGGVGHSVGDGEDANASAAAKKLLNMKWDHIGLNQLNYSKLPDSKVSGAQLAKMYA